MTYGTPGDWTPRVINDWPKEFIIEKYRNYFVPNRDWWRDMFVRPTPTIPGSFFFYRPRLDQHIRFPVDTTQPWCCYMVSLPLGKTWTPVTFSVYDGSHDRPLKASVIALFHTTKVVVELPQADVLAKSIHGRDAHVFIEFGKDGLTYSWTHAQQPAETFAYLTSYHEIKDKWDKFLEWEWKPYWLSHHANTDGMLAW